MSFAAHYFNGINAQAKSVFVDVTTDSEPSLTFTVDGEARSYPVHNLKIQAKLGKIKRIIECPDGGRIEAHDISEVEAVLPSKNGLFWTFIHYIENHLAWVVTLFAVTVLTGGLFLQYGIPKLAEYVVRMTPANMEDQLGEQILNSLDHPQMGYFSASKLQTIRQQQITGALNNFCQAFQDCPQHRLEFRVGGNLIGANAFALPGHIMVVTDELVALAKNNTEIIAVLAHELGHVQQRHPFRQSLQSLLSGLVLAVITGDVNSLASGLGGVLIQMHYSQDHETEADIFALNALQKACLPPKAFAEMLLRLQQSQAGNKKNQNNNPVLQQWEHVTDKLSKLFSTHPNTALRIKPFLEAESLCSH